MPESTDEMTLHGGGYHFIATVLDMQVSLPLQITPTLKLECANDAQIDIIRNFLETKIGAMRFDNRQNYECDCIEKKDGGVTLFEWKPLKKTDWRYYLLTFKGNGMEVYNFLDIADLVAPHVSSFAHCYTTEEFGRGNVVGAGTDPLRTSKHHLKINHHSQIFNSNSLASLQDIFGKYKALDKNKYEGIERAIKLNSNLRRMADVNNLVILGLFMIIEMLLTHNPNEKEVGDSLTHQIKTKIEFLSSRFKEPLNYSVFGDQVSSEKIWGSLYVYRSCIAHGNSIDFTTGKLQVLKNADLAYDFLNTATRTLLAHALAEPEVINGLKPI